MLSKNFLSARYLNEFTVAGVFAASMATVMVPTFVFTAIEYFAVLSISIFGSGDALGVGVGVGAAALVALVDGGAAGAAESSLLPPPVRLTEAYATPPAATTTATTDAMMVLRRLAFRRASALRCCCRSNFCRAICRRRSALLTTGSAPRESCDRSGPDASPGDVRPSRRHHR